MMTLTVALWRSKLFIAIISWLEELNLEDHSCLCNNRVRKIKMVKMTIVTEMPVRAFHIVAASTFQSSLAADSGGTLVKTPVVRW